VISPTGGFTYRVTKWVKSKTLFGVIFDLLASNIFAYISHFVNRISKVNV